MILHNYYTIEVAMNEGLEYELYAFALAHDGRAICRLKQENEIVEDKHAKGKVVFVANVLPKQKIIARIVQVKKNYVLGELVSILESPDYDSPDTLDICAHADSCGGCILQKMPYSEQLFWKEKILTDSLERIANIKDCRINPILPSPKLWNYRNKMQFAFAGDQGNLSLGLRVKASHEVVNIEHCKLMPEISMQIIKSIKAEANNLKLDAYAKNDLKGSGFLRFVNIRMPLVQGGKQQCLVNIITSKSNAIEYQKIEKLAEILMAKHSEITGFVHDIRYKDDYFAIGDKTIFSCGQTKLWEKLSGINYTFGHKSFFQVNTAAAEFIAKELELSLDLSKNAIVWDLFSGVGAPCMFLAKKVKQITGIESTSQATKFANANAQTHKFGNCRYHVGQVHQEISRLDRPDIVIMDPPRTGLHISIIEQLLEIKPAQIVYISCDCATLSRDLKLLTKIYAVHRVQPLDFFPQTPHVECIVSLRLM